MAIFKKLTLLLTCLAVPLVADVIEAPDCTYATEAPEPRRTATSGVLKIHTRVETVTKRIDCAGCNNVHVLPTLASSQHERSHEVTSSEVAHEPLIRTVYECEKSAAPKPERPHSVVGRDVADITTIFSTRTVTAYTSTVTAMGIFNCTSPYYYRATQQPAVSARQVSGSSTTASTTVPAVTSTATAWTVITATQAEPFVRTVYACATTQVIVLTTAATTTIGYNVTAYEATARPLSTVICPGVGGFPTSAAAAPPAPTATRNAILGGELIAMNPDHQEDLTTIVTTISSITRTVYSAVTITQAGTLTNAQTTCSTLAFDVTSTYPLVFTSYASTTTAVRYIYCRSTPSASAPIASTTSAMPTGMIMRSVPEEGSDVEARGELFERQTSSGSASSAASETYHRTSYVPSSTTVAATAPFTRTVYACYTPSTTATPVAPPTTTASA